MNPLQLFLLPTLNLEMKKKKVWPVGVFLCWAQVGDSGSSSLAPHTLLSCPCWQWSHDLHLPLMLDVKSNSPLKISSCLMQCQNRPETLQSCQKNSKLRLRCFSSWCPVFLCILLDHKKWLEWLDGFFPVSLQEALLHGGSLKTPALTLPLHPASVAWWIYSDVIQSFPKHVLHSKYMHEEFKEEEMYRLSSF